MKNRDSMEQVKNGGHSSFNMLDALDNLKKAGMPNEHAEAVVRLQYGLIESHLATKRDIAETKRDIAEIKRDIAELRKATKDDLELAKLELKKDIELVRAELKKYVSDQGWKTIRWTAGLLALFVTILKYVLQVG